MSNDFLTREQIEKLLAVKIPAIRETTMEDIQLIRQNIDRLIEHHRKHGMGEAVKESLLLQERLDETIITVTNETEQQISYSFKYPEMYKENYVLQDSAFMSVDKN